MFDIHCPTAGRRVLIWTSRLAGIRNVHDAIELDFRCLCGASATLRTGAGVREELVRHDEASVSHAA